MMTNKKISVTIPAYNEQDTLQRVVEQAITEVSKLSNRVEILLVDDGSTDRTGSVIASLTHTYPRVVRSISHPKNRGFSAAMNTCYVNADGDYIFLGPADGQFDFSEVASFVRKMAGHDIVVGYRTYNEETVRRKINSFFFHLLARALFGIRLKEFSSCIMYTRNVRDTIHVQADSYACLFLPELMYRSIQKGYAIGEVPIHFYVRKGGKQKGTNIRMIVKTIYEMLRFKVELIRSTHTA